MQRRSVLKLLLGAAAFSAAPRVMGAPKATGSSSRPPPRYFVRIMMSGGIDAILTTDPKTKSEVESWVDLPYGPKEIVETGGIRLGPNFAGLSNWGKRFSVINGVQLFTANHDHGVMQSARMSTHVNAKAPSFAEIVGSHRDTQALATVFLGDAENVSENVGLYHPSWFGAVGEPKSTLLSRIEKSSKEELADLVDILHEQVARMRRTGGGREQQRAIQSVEDCAKFYEAVLKAPKYEAEKWSDVPKVQRLAEHLQRTLWLLENDLTRCVEIYVTQFGWDTHSANALLQPLSSQPLSQMVDKFLDRVSNSSNNFGPLFDNLVLLMGSEIGRFPRINEHDGKDHYPEAPFLILGPNIAAGQTFGSTSRRMSAEPISIKTGKASQTDRILPDLNDVGRTLLDVLGVPAEPYGYTGQHLSFLT